ncbi:hypothetical protein ACHAWF_018510 [Thalassiosira exigua]
MVWINEPADDEVEASPALVTQFYFREESPPYPDVLQLDVVEVDPNTHTFGSYVNGTIVVDDGSTVTGDELLPLSPWQVQGPFYPKTNFFSMDNDLTTATDASAMTARPTLFTEVSAIDSTEPTISGQKPPIQSTNDVTSSTSTSPTLQPVKMTPSDATAQNVSIQYYLSLLLAVYYVAF